VPWHPDRPHNDLAPLPPGCDLESRPVLKACVRSAATLAALDRAGDVIPDAGILIDTLPFLEAQASSEIENVVTTTDAMFRHVGSEAAADPATKEALRYRHALMEVLASLSARPSGTRTAEAICSRIKGRPMKVRTAPGTVIARAATGAVVYTPPEGERRLRDLLADWEQFVHGDDDLEPLVRFAIAHYQFEAIHPFVDGNGRTGRVLNSLFLVERGLLRLPILYLSRFIIRQREDYYRLLLEVTRDAAWEPWILYVLRGIEETARWTLAKIEALHELREETAALVRSKRRKIYGRELVDTIFRRPYCRIADLVGAGVAQRQAASRYLKALADLGLLEERKEGREKFWVHTRLLALLARDES